MGRRRGPEGAYTFDLVPDEGEAGPDAVPDGDGGGGDGAGGGAPPRGPGRWQTAWRRTSRRTRLTVLVVGVALVGTYGVVREVSDRDHVAELRAAAGGVLDLSVPPQEIWRVEDLEESADVSRGLVAVAGDVAAVQRLDHLIGLDLATGERRWTVDLMDPSGTCGPGMEFWSERVELNPSEQVVCVGESGAGEQTVTVVEPDGTVLARRAIGDGYDLAVPGPGSSVLTATWVGEPDDVDVSLQGDPLTDLRVTGEIDDGYDLEVTLVDALTGDERWTSVVPFGEVLDTDQCVRWSAGGRNAELDRAGTIDHVVGERLVGVSGCGILAYLTPTGSPLDLSGLQSSADEVVRRVRPLADGGFAVSAGGWGRAAWDQDVLDADGVLRFSVEGRLLDPWATDGAADGVAGDRWLVARADGTVAVDGTGEEVWSSDVQAVEVLARTARTAVVMDVRDRLVGLDLADGTVLWVRPDVVDEVAATTGEARHGGVRSVFTDGAVVALVVPVYTDASVISLWRAVDVTTGEDLWSSQQVEDGWGVEVAVDGHLLRWWPKGLAALGAT
ncbi:PQQ-binding-like beta-propeller repeat protein [Isoptericola jiangsuensis]|uniref:outer membrane protein assembly factor BamB family protein n=1 Tax=Isoptericola jiangsuensis TaxID=548579 RepID=UPI003AAFA341